MQSGISASKELREQFHTLLSTPSTFALLVGIENEQLVPKARVPLTSSFSSDLAALKEHMQPSAAVYAIVRRYNEDDGDKSNDGAAKLAAITYVPDAAPVRQKTLFASTRLTLTRELGAEHFRETMLFTTVDEFTEEGLGRHGEQAQMEAPLTEEERTLGMVRQAEEQEVSSGGTGARAIHLSKSLAMPVSEETITALGEMAQGKRVVTMLKINTSTEVVELVPESPTPGSVTELSGVISKSEPRFTFFRFRHREGRSGDGEEKSPVLFFYTCPMAEGGAGRGGIKQRMMYPLMKRAVLAVAEQEAGLQVEKRFEVEETSEVTEELVMGELYPRVVAKQGFSRPKRPGR